MAKSRLLLVLGVVLVCVGDFVVVFHLSLQLL